VLYKYAPKEFKLRLLKFLNNVYREKCIPNEWIKAVITSIFKEVAEGNPRTTEELVFSTPAVRYTLESLI